LRGTRTLDMLDELGKEGWVTRDAVADLRASYLFLREIEHRLQMIADEQTQRLPKDQDTLARFARFCGYTRKKPLLQRSHASLAACLASLWAFV